LVQRHPDVELVGDSGGVDGLGVSLAQRPQALSAGGVIGDERVVDSACSSASASSSVGSDRAAHSVST
jgi:hypothetical protein